MVLLVWPPELITRKNKMDDLVLYNPNECVEAINTCSSMDSDFAVRLGT